MRRGKLGPAFRSVAAAVAVAALAPLSTPGPVRAEDSPKPPQEAPRLRAEEGAAAVVKVQEAVQSAQRQVENAEASITLEFVDDSDWLMTGSGEWVRGGIDWMRDDIMEFDSDEFGPLEIHMRDVVGIHSAEKNTYIFDDRTALYGRAMVTRERVLVETESGVEVRSRDMLWSIVEGGQRELDYWSLRLNLGLSGNRGNSRQIDFNLGFNLEREDKRTLTKLDYLLNLGRAEGEQTVARHIVQFLNKVWIKDIFFVEPIVGQLLSDRFQDITFRAQPAATLGVRFLDKPRAWWELTGGLGYQYLNLYRPLFAEDETQHDGLARFATRARFDFTPDIYLTLFWATNLTYTTIGNTNHTGMSELFIEVTNIFDFTFTFLFLRTEEPYQRENGTFPEKNDYFFVLGVALQLG